jgi:nickel/cobalt transporter (NicO) family protein
VAGGLVPSPTALLVLLGAIGLGRTWFGVALVLCYGLGMAATLTAAGLLLVGLRDRLEQVRVSDGMKRRAAWLVAAAPVLTAGLVLVVGVGIALRGLAGAA